MNLGFRTITAAANQLHRRLFSTSRAACLIQKWRQDRGLPMNPNAHGALTDKQDYTYLDGRPTPYGANQKRRIVKQREIAAKIVALTAEVDYAVERHERLAVEERERVERIVRGKLKPKGDLLLKK